MEKFDETERPNRVPAPNEPKARGECRPFTIRLLNPVARRSATLETDRAPRLRNLVGNVMVHRWHDTTGDLILCA